MQKQDAAIAARIITIFCSLISNFYFTHKKCDVRIYVKVTLVTYLRGRGFFSPKKNLRLLLQKLVHHAKFFKIITIFLINILKCYYSSPFHARANWLLLFSVNCVRDDVISPNLTFMQVWREGVR